ncbi:MAG: 3-dehydroquinate synthase [Lentisphaeria bacterium]|nr:3-dehydroquinate synthase [Lentisphaeria bacterium]
MERTPEKVRVNLGDRSYNILVAPGLLSSAPEALRPFVEGRGVLVVADSNTGALYGSRIMDLVSSLAPASCALHIFPAGESSKNFATVEQICRAACQAKLDRKGIVLALGGGVTGDMAGFGASIYMRGIEFIQIPTSMLAMIDSSVGGKTGVDLPEGKNLMGTFHQPKLVLIDTDFLNTLPPDQLRSGLAELLKHAVLFDPVPFQI